MLAATAIAGAVMVPAALALAVPITAAGGLTTHLVQPSISALSVTLSKLAARGFTGKEETTAEFCVRKGHQRGYHQAGHKKDDQYSQDRFHRTGSFCAWVRLTLGRLLNKRPTTLKIHFQCRATCKPKMNTARSAEVECSAFHIWLLDN